MTLDVSSAGHIRARADLQVPKGRSGATRPAERAYRRSAMSTSRHAPEAATCSRTHRPPTHGSTKKRPDWSTEVISDGQYPAHQAPGRRRCGRCPSFAGQCRARVQRAGQHPLLRHRHWRSWRHGDVRHCNWRPGAFVGLAGDQTIAGIKTFSSTISGSIDGNASTATKLATARTFSITGDAAGSASFDGSANASIVLTLANSGATAGTYGSATQVSGDGRCQGARDRGKQCRDHVSR
jgi:hypothetical protein